MTSTQLDILALMAADPIHDRDKTAVIAAVREAARRCNGTISRNDLNIPVWVHHKMVGATISGLIRSRALTPVGWVTSTDTRGRNAGRPARQYRADLTALAAQGGDTRDELDHCQDCGSDEEPCECQDPLGGAH